MNKIHRIKCGNVNCYIIENENTGVLVDTGKMEYLDKVTDACRQYNTRLIILTHAHFDHAENAAAISKALAIPIAMSEKDIDLIKQNSAQKLFAETFFGKIVLSVSLKDFSSRPISEFNPDILLKDGDCLTDYGIDARIVSLSGHTEGSIGVDVENRDLIVGDALMNMFYPTVSMLYHDKGKMLASAEKIGEMGKRTIYFGHGRPLANRLWIQKNRNNQLHNNIKNT